MKRFTIVGLCLVAVFAVTAVIASSASAAAPEYFTCLKASPKNTGEYTEKECFTKAGTPKTGGYERAAWNAGKKHSFKGKGKDPKNNQVNPLGECLKPTEAEKKAKEESTGKPVECEEYSKGVGKVEGTTECKTESLVGELTGPKTDTWKTTYKSCEASKNKCLSKDKKSGEIVTEQLEGELVFLNAAKTKVGLRVKSTDGPIGGVSETHRLAQYACGPKTSPEAVNIEAFGEVLTETISPLEKAQKAQKNEVKEGPLKLQGTGGMYVEEAPFGSLGEAYGKGWWEYEEALLACEAKGHTKAECEVALGGANPVPVKPLLIESVDSGAITALAPDNQNGVTENKGEAEGISG